MLHGSVMITSRADEELVATPGALYIPRRRDHSVTACHRAVSDPRGAVQSRARGLAVHAGLMKMLPAITALAVIASLIADA